MRQALRAAPAKPVHYKRRRLEETILYRLLQDHLETFLAEVEAGGVASLPQFVKGEFDAFLECGILRRAFAPRAGRGAWRKPATWLVDHVIPKVPVRQWVLAFPIPLRRLLAVHPKLLAPVLQIIYRVIATHLIKKAGAKRSEAASGVVTLIQRFGSASRSRTRSCCAPTR